jgi:putative hydrolase of the HAD superfamily
MSGGRFEALVLDFAGVLTSNMVEVIGLFERRERLPRGVFLRAWAAPRGQDLYRRLETGEIGQRAWNEGFAELIQADPANLMGRLLQGLEPALPVLRVVWAARLEGIRTAVLSNSLGREPYDPYGPYRLDKNFDVVVFSSDLGIRKPDPRIFEHVLGLLGVPASACVFADDTEDNVEAAAALGLTAIHALDADETAWRLRALLGLSRPPS